MSQTLFTATLFALLTVSAASAQNRSALQASIPFDFTVGQQAMSAGTYRIAFNPNSSLLTIKGEDVHAGTAFVLAIPALGSAARGTGALVFDCEGSACSLAKILPAADSGHRSLQLSQPARRLQIAAQMRVVPLLLAER